MIISHSKKFIFFKPMKVAGTSVESALWRGCDKDIDLYTGAILKSEIKNSEINLSPVNNWKENRVLDRSSAEAYFKKNKQYDMLNSLRNNRNIKRVRLADPIFYEHTSPKMIKESYLDSLKDYRKVSIFRNPYDMMVSYYWWAFNVGDTNYDSFNIRYKKNRRNCSNLAPNKLDSIELLKNKMKKFYYMPANFSQTYRNKNKDQTVIEWIAEWQNEFFLFEMDIWIDFNDLALSYENACDSLLVEKFSLPRFKSGLRKNKYHFMDYYDGELLSDVKNLFSKSIERFKY